ncbi:hypothetical protein Q8W27_15385, partial [Oceanobacter sp. 2_MG-2023]|nr:hypothetical protein [Oceanobacter sp. 1_MG-2023]MDP2613657.1 hypothetical protein [Oceanobacter sp. 2_MG-2023]
HSTTAFRPLQLRKTLKYCPGLVDHYSPRFTSPTKMTKKAAQYDPAILLKIILFAYSKGITSSREIPWCCEINILCIESERLSDF